jgi:uncharacterized protein (TIGR02391 family)
MDARLIAVQVGDALKYATSVNEIDRIGGAVLKIHRDTFPNDAITSVRAQRVHDWVLSLARKEMDPSERERRLIKFCRELAGHQEWPRVAKVLVDAGVSAAEVNRDNYNIFMGRGFHEEVIKHSRPLFLDGHLFHAVFEAAKAYNKAVREKAQSTKDGQPLMLEVWGWEKGCLKVTACKTDSDKNVQDGIKFLSAGLMGAIRNPTAHEPAVDWPISLPDCLDILSFISFLFRQLDKAVYFKP